MSERKQDMSNLISRKMNDIIPLKYIPCLAMHEYNGNELSMHPEIDLQMVFDNIASGRPHCGRSMQIIALQVVCSLECAFLFSCL
jgi:hypothetical protein